MRTMIAVLDKRGENAVPTVVAALEKMHAEEYACFGLATPSKIAREKDAESLHARRLNSSIAVGYASTVPSNHELQLLKLEKATLVFEGRIYSPTSKASVTDALAEKMRQPDCAKAATSFLKGVEGDFSLLIAKAEEILAARDPVGVEPLYYGENKAIAALASNLKALWKLGIEEPRSFPPGNLAAVTRDGFKFEPVKTLEYQKPKTIELGEAAETLQKMLERSMRRRVFGQKEVAVAFSGGLDSSIVACLAKKCGVGVHLIHVSLEGQPETEEARKAAEKLELPLQVHLFTGEDVEKVISKVVDLIEEPDPIKASVGVPFYWTAEKTAAAGYHVMLAGQGADELFGGYQRYVTEYLREGDEKVRRTMFRDVTEIHESNIERDVKICEFHDVELRLPFASYEIAKFAMSLPTELKLERKQDSLRKLVLRKTAKHMGLPDSIADKPKKAVQYSTGISSALKKLAKKRSLTLTEYLSRIFSDLK